MGFDFLIHEENVSLSHQQLLKRELWRSYYSLFHPLAVLASSYHLLHPKKNKKTIVSSTTILAIFSTALTKNEK